AALAVGLAAGAFVAIWRQGHRGFRNALLGLLVGVLVLLIPGYTLLGILEKPALSDIATDPENPPSFIAAARVRGPGQNPVAFDPSTIPAQRRAYPGIGPVELDVPVEEAYRLVMEGVVAARWRILDEQAPANGMDGRVEATAASLLFGF